MTCPNCAIDLPSRREMPPFTAEVLAERARLAMLEPEAERDAVVPLGGVRARQILLHLAEPAPPRLHIVAPGSSLNERDILDRLGCDPDKDRGMVRCPAHEDRSASLSWRWKDGRALLRCFAGCSFDEIRGAL
jgi:hypothetical protein